MLGFFFIENKNYKHNKHFPILLFSLKTGIRVASMDTLAMVYVGVQVIEMLFWVFMLTDLLSHKNP